MTVILSGSESRRAGMPTARPLRHDADLSFSAQMLHFILHDNLLMFRRF